MLGAVFRSLSLCFMVFAALWAGVESASAQLQGQNPLQGLQGLQGLQNLPNLFNQNNNQQTLTPNAQNYAPVDPTIRPLAPPSRWTGCPLLCPSSGDCRRNRVCGEPDC